MFIYLLCLVWVLMTCLVLLAYGLLACASWLVCVMDSVFPAVLTWLLAKSLGGTLWLFVW